MVARYQRPGATRPRLCPGDHRGWPRRLCEGQRRCGRFAPGERRGQRRRLIVRRGEQLPGGSRRWSGTVEVETEIADEFRDVSLFSTDDPIVRASFLPIRARFISISSEDEVALTFDTVNTVGPVIRIGSNRQPTQTISLPLAIPLDSVSMVCFSSEVEDCTVLITIVGT